MKIGIEINGVLRDTIGKITQLYQKHMIDGYEDIFSNQTFKLDSQDNIEVEEVVPFKYEILSEVSSLNLRNHFSFQSDEELYDFMYCEFPMQIFGHASSTEMSTFNILNEIYLSHRDEYDFYIISDEIGKSKPATLFFLSKFGCLVEKIHFYSNTTITSMWNEIDVLLTANPDLLLNHPNNKHVIKFETQYNTQVDFDLTIKTLKELPEIIKNLKND